MPPVVVDALVEVAQRRLQPQPLEERLRPAKQRPRRAREEQEPEHERPEHEHAFEPQVAAHVVFADREQEPDRSEGHRRRASDAALEEHGPRDDRRPPRMPSRGLDDADRVAAERRREHLTGRVCDEVRAREPGNALEDVVRARSQPQRSASTGTVTTTIATASANHARFVSARTSSVVPSSIFQIRYAIAAAVRTSVPTSTRSSDSWPRTSSVSSS